MRGSPVVKELPFAALPHQPRPFLDYVQGSPEALSLYARKPTLQGIQETEQELRRTPFPRPQLASILTRENELFGIDDSVRESIERLSRPHSVAVLTGQQVGLFTGPALTIYKALTAIHLSVELRRSGIEAVPIFWMASDDHDLAEITRLVIAGPDRSDSILDARKPLFGASAVRPMPVGTIRLPHSIRSVIDSYCASLPGPFAAAARAGIEATYQPDTTFGEAFGKLLARILQGRGLVIFDPRDREAKQLAGPVIQKALEEARTIRKGLQDAANRLRAAGMQPQVAVPPRSTLIFMEDNNGRRLLVADESDFRIKDTDARFTLESMRQIVHEEPWRFSPNVLLRPVVQDHLFPTVAYVGGPAEISYFAQLAPLYQFYARPMPVAWPRSSFTVLDPESRGTMERYGLELEDCIQGQNHVLEKMVRQSRPAFEEPLSELRTFIESELPSIKPLMAAVDPSLGQATDTVQRKLLYRTESLRRKIVNGELRNNIQLRREFLRLMHCCYPLGNMQERELTIHDLLARHGPPLLDTIASAITLSSFTHKIIGDAPT